MLTHLQWQVEISHLTDLWTKQFSNSEERTKKQWTQLLKMNRELVAEVAMDE